MFKIALTGSPLSGKKTVNKLFRSMGTPIFDADLVTKFLIHYDSKTIKNIHHKFGPKAYEIGFLKPSFFKTDKQIELLLDLVKDDVQNLYHKFCSRNSTAPYVIFKCSYFYETGMETWKELKMSYKNNKTTIKIPFKAEELQDSSIMGDVSLDSKPFFDGIINVHSPVDVRIFRNQKIRKTLNFTSEYDVIKKKELSRYNIECIDNINLLEQVEKVHHDLLFKTRKLNVNNN